MPRLPDYTSLDTVTPQSQRSVVSYSDATGAATEQLGQSIEKTGEVVGAYAQQQAQHKNVLQSAYAESSLLQGVANAQVAATKGTDYQNYATNYDQATGDVLKSAAALITDPQQRELFVAKAGPHINTIRNTVVGQAEVQHKNAFIASTDENNYNLAQTALNSPDPRYGAAAIIAAKNSNDALVANKFITPDEGFKRNQEFVQNFSVERGKVEIERDPRAALKMLSAPSTPSAGQASAPLTSDDPIINDAAATHNVDPGTLSRIAQIESNGNPNAKNPNSSASGMFQFTSGTAKAYGLSDPSDPVASADAAARKVSDDSAMLKKSLGRDPSPAESYLAWQQGPSGANALLSNPGDNAIDTLARVTKNRKTAEDSIINNGGNADMTAAEFTGKWVDKFNGGSGVAAVTGGAGADNLSTTNSNDQQAIFPKTNDWRDYLPLDKRVALIKYATTAAKQLDAIDEKEQTAKDAAAGADFEVAFNQGKKNQVDIQQARQDGIITDAKYVSLMKQADDDALLAKEDAQRMAIVQDRMKTGTPIDPKDKELRKGVNMLYSETAKNWSADGTEDMPSKAVQFAASAGMLPDAVQGMIRGALRSNDSANVLSGVDMVRKIRGANEQLLHDLPEEDLSIANHVGALIDSGIDPKDAVAMAKEAQSVPKAIVDTRKADYNKAVKDKPSSKYVSSQLDQFWRIDPNIPNEMGSEFDTAARAEYERTGNMDAAKQTALDGLKKTWAITQVGNGGNRYMKYAPEQFYGVQGVDNSKWINTQLQDDVKALGHPADIKDIIINPAFDKQLDDGKPSYYVSTKDKNGVWRVVTTPDMKPKLWQPDYKASPEYINQQAKLDKSRVSAQAERKQRFGFPSIPPKDFQPTQEQLDAIP